MCCKLQRWLMKLISGSSIEAGALAKSGSILGIAAQLMRRILVDYARKRDNAKRGDGARHLPLDEAMVVVDEQAADVLALDEALKILTTIDLRQSQMVELRFFGGLSIEETAEVLKVSPGTVMREWTFAKAWLQREMTSAP